MILHLTTDLMATSGLRAEARKNEVVVKMVSKPMELQSLLENHEVSLLVIDLQTLHLDIQALTDALPSDSEISVVAYAQHVRTELFAAASAAGIKNVMTRGQFTNSIPVIVQKALES